MLNPQSFKKDKQKKSIKNIYIHKINSLLKIVGDSNSSLPCLSKVRKNILLQSQQHLALQRKQNNKDAARKARLRKKIYMQLLESTIENLQKLNQQGKMLQKSSKEMLTTLRGSTECKQEDEIDKYLSQIGIQKQKKQQSQSTMDLQKGSELKKILVQIEMLSYPEGWNCENLCNIQQTPQNVHLTTKMQSVQQQLPQLFIELRNICSQHSSLLALSSTSKSQCNADPYFCKTLMQEYFSKTLCKKDAIGLQTQKQLGLLTKMQKYRWRAQQINQSDFLAEK